MLRMIPALIWNCDKTGLIEVSLHKFPQIIFEIHVKKKKKILSIIQEI